MTTAPAATTAAFAHGHAAQDHGSGADPGIIANPNRALVKRDVARMAVIENLLDLLVPRRRLERMSEIVEDVRRMRDQHAIADDDGGGRPDAAAFADIAPFADLDLAAMRERSIALLICGMCGRR